ncbi:CARDB domain-containing protein [Sorangium cellulosum]|uniref:CARDB domain-containing protein n=1 Tax=Sorangium cellulosum TaxID=56 RepID=UPI00067703BE|nr:CARDB domain-containing protein [Sorangium cellulosum]
MRRACFVFGMLAMTVGCGSSGPPDDAEPVGAATGALTGNEPDLVLSSASAPPSVLPGGYFTTWVTVCNQGDSASYSTQVEVSLSDDDIITPSDPITGYAPLGYLDPGQCVELGVQTAAAVPDGAYTLGVVVDSFEQVIELSETNNAAVAGEIGVGYGPDLIVSAVSGPPSALPGGGFEVQATVCNQGTTSSQSALVDVLLSPDAAIEPSDHLLGGTPVPWLDPGQCASVTVPASASVPEGAYHLGAIAHESGWYAELITSNNTLAGGLLGVGYQPDLVVSAVSGPPSQVPGAWFDASVTVCNQGTQPSYGNEVDLLLSPDGEITLADFPIGYGYVPNLNPGQCFSTTIPANTYVPDGAYTLGAIVDVPDWTAELIETNNAAAGGAMGVGYRPDLVVSSVSGPPSVFPGGGFSASVTVCNQGTTQSYGGDIAVVLSSDQAITPFDAPAGGGYVPGLSPGQCASVAVPANAYVPDGAYHLGAVVDPSSAIAELIETNNAAAGSLIGVGHGPDLIVSAVSGPPSVFPGGGFDASVTVCNQGTQTSYGTHVELRVSADATLTTADSLAGGGPVPYLDPGQCATVTFPASAYVPEGAYHLGAIVDPQGGVPELIETNNATPGDLLGVGAWPDLVVSAVSGPSSVTPGSSFNAAVTVCNQGTTQSYGADVELLLSSDGTITPSDIHAGNGVVPGLNPGQCAAVVVPAGAYVPDGAHHLGAIVDPSGALAELIETNNAAAGSVIGVGYAPDLVVSAVSGPPSMIPGGSFDASVTVCNQGTQTSYGTQVELLLSADATLTIADSPAGSGPVPYLDPGQCATVTFPASVYVPDGAYHLGAIVDRDNWIPELIETNNAEVSAMIGVGNWPDLIVSAVSGPPSATPGSGFDASVTVCNQGTQPSYGSDVELYLSADAAITEDDTPAGAGMVPFLAPGQCTSVLVFASAYVPDGTYHLGAIVDVNDWHEELIESNNGASGDLIGVGFQPDLVVSAVSGPPSAPPGSGFDASVTVCNQGTSPSYGVDLELFLSSDDAISPADIHAGNGYVPGLSPGQCTSVLVFASAYGPDGAYRLGAIVDPSESLVELIESNNAVAGSVLGVGFGPDFIVSAVSGPPSVAPGDNFNAEVTVCNQGTQAGYGGDVELRLSSDATITTADFLAGNGPAPYLAPGQCTTVTFPASASNVPWGAYHLGAIVDPYDALAELIETNNAAAGSVLGVGYQPDLIVSSVSGPPSVIPGGSFDASVTVCNQGTQPSYGTQVDLLLSADATLTIADSHAGNGPVPYLDPGQCATVTFPASAYVPDGAYHLGAIVDRDNWVPELIETNNAEVSAMIGIGSWPDLIVSAVSGPPSALPGSGFDASVTVCNQGTQPSYGTDVDLYLSADATITAGDTPAGGGMVPFLAPGQCAAVPVAAILYVPDGTYHLGAIVDADDWQEELIESNNAASGDLIGVGFGPDLVVSSVSGPPSTPPGSGFDASVTVCNQGTSPSYGVDVELFLSSDDVIAPSDLHAGIGHVAGLSPGQCTSVLVFASAYGPDGAHRLGAIVDPGKSIAELIETNNASAGSVLGVGYRPDLIVSAVEGPPSALPGSSFDAEITVCNQGTQPSYGSDVELRLAASGQAASAGVIAGGAPVPYLDPGQCTVVPIPAYAAVPDGAYRLAAVVDPFSSTQELIETNNTNTSSVFGVGYGPDLIASASGPSTAAPGSGFDAIVTVCNQGTTPSGGTSVEVLLSSDGTVTPSDIHVGNGWVPGLSPGQCESITVAAGAYAPDGAYHLGAIVDLNGPVQELIETNNAAAGELMAIGYGPDLVVSAVSGPPSATQGSLFDASVTVCNEGTAPSYGTMVEVRLSADATITTADFLAGGAWVPSLGAGQCESLIVAADTYVPVDTYTLGAIVDAYGEVPELLDGNNATAGGELVVSF